MFFTISGPDLQLAFDCSPQSVVRWFKTHPDGHPPHVKKDRVIFYRLRDVVVRLRDKLPTTNSKDHCVRQGGLYGEDLANIVALDALRRREMEVDDIYVGDDPDGIRDLLRSLTEDETERYRDMRVAFTYAAAACGLTPERYVDRLILHPAILRYTLTGDEEELPTLHGWPSWARAFATVNLPNDIEKVAA